MSKLIIKFDKDIPSFQLIQENLNPYYCDVIASLNKSGYVILFDNVSFGFDIKRGEEIVIKKSYPPMGVTYVKSDQSIIRVERVVWGPDWELVMRVWVKMSGNYMEQSFNVTIPRPPQPYSSWTWDGSNWQPPIPIPIPISGIKYIWDEGSRTWIEWIDPHLVSSSSSSYSSLLFSEKKALLL